MIMRRNLMGSRGMKWKLGYGQLTSGKVVEREECALSDFVEIPSAHTITWRHGFLRNTEHYNLCEFDSGYVRTSYWGASGVNGVRRLTKWDYPDKIKYIRFVAAIEEREYCWVLDNVTGLYLWKGKKVD